MLGAAIVITRLARQKSIATPLPSPQNKVRVRTE